MSKDSSNGRYVTLRELNDKLNAVRWELRCYALVLVLAVLLKFNVPGHSTALALAAWLTH